MSEEEIHTLEMFKEFTQDELLGINLVLTYFDEMKKVGIISEEDIKNFGNIDEKKQNEIVMFIQNKLKG